MFDAVSAFYYKFDLFVDRPNFQKLIYRSPQFRAFLMLHQLLMFGKYGNSYFFTKIDYFQAVILIFDINVAKLDHGASGDSSCFLKGVSFFLDLQIEET